MLKPLCFVLMPFGRKPAGGDGIIDFDSVYNQIIKPAVEEAGLEPIRADEEVAGGIIHKPMFERLVLCDYAIADLTTANANVFYELGVRHAAKSRSTVLLFAEGHGRLPFDVAQLRALPYDIGKNGRPKSPEEASASLLEKLNSAKIESDTDSPLYQLLDDYPDVAHEKTDIFRERVAYENSIKRKLSTARESEDIEALSVIEQDLEPISDQEAGVVIDLFLSYRAVSSWQNMIQLYQKMGPIIADTALAREQLALALNRDGQSQEAETILKRLIEQRGVSSETLGILGRVYKDRWRDALSENNTSKARGLLRRAISTYTQGFESDWRDAYPGVNAVTLDFVSNPRSINTSSLFPIVKYAVKRRMEACDPDYWDYATVLELAVLENAEDRANDALADALGAFRESWELSTTADNLVMIRDACPSEDTRIDWLNNIIEELRDNSRQ